MLRKLLTLLAFVFPTICYSQTVTTGPLTVNVADMGITPGGDDTAAIQAAYDAVAAKVKLVQPGVDTKGVLYFPGSTQSYKLSRSIMADHDHIEIKGDGSSTMFQSMPGTSHNHFTFGIRRWAGTPAQYAAYRPSTAGRLDASVGARFGWNPKDTGFLMAVQSPFSNGGGMNDGSDQLDNWTNTTALTIEIAIDGLGPIPVGIVFGAGVGTKSDPHPFILYSDAIDHFTCLFGTQSVPYGPVASHRLGFKLPPVATGAPTLRRITLQVDLAASLYPIFVDNKQVGLDFDQMNLPKGNSLRFAENDLMPFLINDSGGGSPGWGAQNLSYDLLGFLISKTARYANGAVGSAQTRIDNNTVPNDAYHFYTDYNTDPGMLAYIAFDDDISLCTRQINVMGGAQGAKLSTGIWFLNTNMLGLGSVNIDQSIRDLQSMGGRRYGSNIGIGQVLKFQASHLRLRESCNSVSSMGFGAIYPLYFDFMDLDGADSSVYLQNSTSIWRNTQVNGAGRVTFRFSGSNAQMYHTNTAFASNNMQCSIKMHGGTYGGLYVFNDFVVDNEGSTYKNAPIYAEAMPYSQVTVRLIDLYLGTTGGASIPVIKLRSPQHWQPATLVVDHLDSDLSPVGKILIDSDGWWHGSVINCPIKTPIILPGDGTGSIVFNPIGTIGAGTAGPMGATGPAGLTGPTGAVGPVGPPGATRPAGATGATGATGPTGLPGPAGKVGAVGPAGPLTPLAGPAGPQGPIGPPGPQGLPGTMVPTKPILPPKAKPAPSPLPIVPLPPAKKAA